MGVVKDFYLDNFPLALVIVFCLWIFQFISYMNDQKLIEVDPIEYTMVKSTYTNFPFCRPIINDAMKDHMIIWKEYSSIIHCKQDKDKRYLMEITNG